MQRLGVGLLFLFIGVLIAHNVTSENVLEHVNMFIGTGGAMFGCGALNPGPQRPFAMVRLGPDTINALNTFVPWEHFGGYHYSDKYIRLFAHTHMGGAGVLDYGNIGIMPTSWMPNGDMVKDYGFKSEFSHEREVAKPHYYSVHLDTPNIFAELAATKYVGVHRYEWKNPEKAHVMMFYISHALQQKDGCKDSDITVDMEKQIVTGSILSFGGLTRRIGGARIYFYAKFSSVFVQHGTWSVNKVFPDQSSINGTDVGAYIRFQDAKVEMYVGISFQSVRQAQVNLESDLGSKKFDDVAKESETVWQRELSTFQVQSSNRTDIVKFYTALYHSLVVPSAWSEVGGTYLGFDKQIHKIDAGSDFFLTEMSLWDTFRSNVPLITFLKPDVARDTVRSLVKMYEQGGDLPRWPIANGYGGSMIGQHANIVIADAWFKGVRDFDVRKAYAGMRQGATQQQRHAGRSGLGNYNTRGWITPADSRVATSQTVEYAFDDWALANMAKELGFKDDEILFRNRSKNYKNHFDPKEKFFCPRDAQGKFDCPLVKTNVFDQRYIEGDAWHWRFFAPHDSEGLIELFGGKEPFVKELDMFFEKAKEFPWNALPNPYYWAGNEHDLFSVWIFPWADRSDLTQKHSRWIMDEKYTDLPDGLDGNDDYGTLSAWYVFSAMGFFPLPGSSLYVVGSPIFDKVEYRHRGGLLTIIAHNQSKQNVFVDRALINGQPLGKFVQHDQLIKGNVVLEFWMKK